MSQIDHLHFGCCCPHEEVWRSTQTNNTWSCTQVSKCIDVDGGIFELLLWTV